MTAARWRPPRRRTAGPHFRAFAQHYCRHTKGRWAGTPLAFEQFQCDEWDEALKLDARGRRVYNFFLSGRPRKNYKTTECAALALYLGGPDGEPGPEVALGSGTKDQAGRVFGQAKQFVEANPQLRHMYVPQSNVILVPSRFGVIQRVSSEGGFQMGLNLSGAVLDELHVFKTAAHRELFAALVTASGAREEPFISSITTAGYDLETLLGEIYLAALELPDVIKLGRFEELTIARDRDSGFLMIWYGAPDDADLDIENPELWRAVNAAQAVTLEYLRKQWLSPHVSDGVFRRLHLNQWTAAEERWLTDDQVRRLRSPETIPDRAPIYVAVDASMFYDTTAVSWSHAIKDGRTVKNTIERTCVFSVRRNVPHDRFIPGGEIDFELVEAFIVDELAVRYRVEEIVYDPKFFGASAQRLARLGFKVAPLPPNSTLMREAVQQMYRDVVDGKARIPQPGPLHDRMGAIERADHAPTLEKHMAATAAVVSGDPPEHKLSKLKTPRPIDATVATTMAHSRAVLDEGTTSIYEHKDLKILGDDEDDQPDDLDDDDDE